MPDPISRAVTQGDIYSYDPDQDAGLRDRLVRSADAQVPGICTAPKGMVAGVLCDDAAAVSDACRTAEPGTPTAYLCDDRNLQKAQTVVVTTAWDILKNIVAAVLVGKVGP